MDGMKIMVNVFDSDIWYAGYIKWNNDAVMQG